MPSGYLTHRNISCEVWCWPSNRAAKIQKLPALSSDPPDVIRGRVDLQSRTKYVVEWKNEGEPITACCDVSYLSPVKESQVTYDITLMDREKPRTQNWKAKPRETAAIQTKVTQLGWIQVEIYRVDDNFMVLSSATSSEGFDEVQLDLLDNPKTGGRPHVTFLIRIDPLKAIVKGARKKAAVSPGPTVAREGSSCASLSPSSCLPKNRCISPTPYEYNAKISSTHEASLKEIGSPSLDEKPRFKSEEEDTITSLGETADTNDLKDMVISVEHERHRIKEENK